MLQSLREAQLLKVEALVAWLGQQRISVDRTLVSHWCAGRSHLPADLLPHLSRFTERPDLVFGGFLQAVGCELFRLPRGRFADSDLVDLILEAGACVGRMQQTLAQARSPGSPGGESVTEEEREDILQRLDDLIHHLVELRGRLTQSDQ